MFHSSHPSLFGRPDAVVTESESLRSTIFALRSISGSLLRFTPRAVSEARNLLSDFSARLSTYFDAEEAGGYFGTIRTNCPELKHKVVALEQAHTDLRDAVASLRRLARDGTDAIDLGRRIALVIDDFEAHEHAENSLLQEFVLRDQGSSE
jgi:hypothetical protein